VRTDIVAQLALRDPLVLAGGFDRPNLAWHVLSAPTPAWKDRALSALLKRHSEGAAVVYAATRRTVDALADYCNSCGIPAGAYHAGMPAPERQRLQDAFMANRVRVMTATTAFGMGVDKPDVRLVLHYALSASLEGYYQEAGRAGRDGAPARCVLLFAPEDALLHEFMIDQSQPGTEVVRAVCAALARLAGADELVRADYRTLAMASSVPANERQVEAVIRRCRAAGLLEGRSDEGPWRLVTRALPPPLDWGEIRAGRLREQHRLAAMLGYVSEPGCRRRYLLRYYGEEAPGRCGGCDRCLGTGGAVLPGWDPPGAGRRAGGSGWRRFLPRWLR
jgi:ATP-dependent DNA helicase RecQ